MSGTPAHLRTVRQVAPRLWSLFPVFEMLGHKNYRTTQRYAHIADSALRDAVNLTQLPGGEGQGQEGPAGAFAQAAVRENRLWHGPPPSRLRRSDRDRRPGQHGRGFDHGPRARARAREICRSTCRRRSSCLPSAPSISTLQRLRYASRELRRRLHDYAARPPDCVGKAPPLEQRRRSHPRCSASPTALAALWRGRTPTTAPAARSARIVTVVLLGALTRLASAPHSDPSPALMRACD